MKMLQNIMLNRWDYEWKKKIIFFSENFFIVKIREHFFSEKNRMAISVFVSHENFQNDYCF